MHRLGLRQRELWIGCRDGAPDGRHEGRDWNRSADEVGHRIIALPLRAGHVHLARSFLGAAARLRVADDADDCAPAWLVLRSADTACDQLPNGIPAAVEIL